MAAVSYFEGLGRRKSSTARVRLMSGSGEFTINNKSLRDYFNRQGDAERILEAFEVTGINPTSMDVTVVVKGGGVTGQADSVKLGLARAMIKMDPEVQPLLKKGNFLTRDPREKERKKPGLKRARKAPTYTKR